MRKKIISLFVLACMLIAMFPTSVMATEPTEETVHYAFVTTEGGVVDGTNVTISLCNEMASANKTVIAETATGKGEFTVSYMGDYFYHEGQEYVYVEISYCFPEGYMLSGCEGVTESKSYYRVEDLHNVNNEIVWLVEKEGDSSTGLTYQDSIVYQFLDEENIPVETVDLKVWLSDTVGPDAELTPIYNSTSSEGEISIEFTDTEYVYNGETYTYLIYKCVFPGYRTWYEPANGYINGIELYYNLNDLKEADFEWIWSLENLEKDEEGGYETEPTEETFSYEFVTADGIVVDGTNVTISLCNEMESENKTVIAKSTAGTGKFTISHMGDYYYHEGQEYRYVEISYSFPKGYVLSDSEGLTGATVYYSVVNLCDGSNEITWFLEKSKDIIIDVPKTDSKDDNAVVILPEEKDEISKDVMDSILEANKKFDVEIKSNDDVIFTFKAGGMKHVDGKTSYDFGVEIKKDFTSLENAPFEEKDFVLRINYDYSGELPGNAEIRIPVGNEWIGKMLYYYQILADGTYKYTGEKAVVDNNGMYTIHQNHCSDYVITAEEPKEKTSDENETTPNTQNTDTTVVSPSTGNDGYEMYVLLIVTLAVCMILCGFKKRHNFESMVK